MVEEIKTLKLVIALAKDVLDARDDLSTLVKELNQQAIAQNVLSCIEIIAWCEEDTYPGFYRESPAALIAEIRREYNPDTIIGVFWKRFGTVKSDPALDAAQEFNFAPDEGDQPDHSRMRLYFLDKSFTPGNEEERKQKEFIIRFRGSFPPETVWQFYKKRSEYRKGQHDSDLRKLAYDYLWRRMNWLATGGASLNPGLNPPPELDLPDGWKFLDPRDLNDLRNDLGEGSKLNDAEAADYFDGEAPTWKIAVSENIPRRRIVNTLTQGISDAAYAGSLRVTLLMGPGGEGKSTILQQVAVDLAERYSGIYVIWRARKDVSLNKSLLQQLLRKQGRFVIVSDDGDQIAHDVYAAVSSSREERRCNIQFFLASRGTDWQWAEAPADAEWQRLLGNKDFVKIPIRQLVLDDAQEIVKAWKNAQALGDFEQVAEDRRPQHLVNLAKDEELKNRRDKVEEGSFLGAMLRTRKSKTFQGYVEQILGRLKEHAALNDKNLQDIFAYIVALHADNLQILTRPILARLLSCTQEELEEKVIDPLDDEAAADMPGWFVLARHRAIAEVSKRILQERYPSRFERRIYPELLTAAIKELKDPDGQLNDYEKKQWNNLARFYFDRKQVEVALNLAKTAAELEPNDPYPVVAWAHIYRDAGKKSEAAETFRSRYKKVKHTRGYFQEWAVAEGQRGERHLSAWLCGIALSDWAIKSERHFDSVPPMMRLSSLTTTLSVLYEKWSGTNKAFSDPANAQTFLQGCVAAAQLGLHARAQRGMRIDYDRKKSERNLNIGTKLGLENNILPVQPNEAIQLIRKSIELAWELRDKDGNRDKDQEQVLDSLPKPYTLSFRTLSALFDVKDDSPTGSSTMPKSLKPRKF